MLIVILIKKNTEMIHLDLYFILLKFIYINNFFFNIKI